MIATPSRDRTRAAGWLWPWITAVVVAVVANARAACNLIPAVERTFPSTLGAISSPFGSPNQTLTVKRPDAAVFPDDPAQITTTLRFQPPGGPSTVVTGITQLAPAAGSDCEPSSCVNAFCTCTRFVFPDTD